MNQAHAHDAVRRVEPDLAADIEELSGADRRRKRKIFQRRRIDLDGFAGHGGFPWRRLSLLYRIAYALPQRSFSDALYHQY